jgi:hypothetical protein
MAERLHRQLVAEKAIVHAQAPVSRAPHEVDRNFELPTALYVLTGLGYAGFVALAAIALGNPELILPLAICFIFIGMYFAVPALWVRMKPDNPRRALNWDRFLRDGVQTATGRIPAKDAMIQVLILPTLIFAWGVAIAAIRAFA